MALVATSKQTGGGGFSFEDKVTAYFLGKMLSGTFSLDPAFGVLKSIQFQVRPDGWLLDDFLLTMTNGLSNHMVAVSAKSNRHITANGLPNEIRKDVWNQFLNIDKKLFDKEKDFLLFVVSPLGRSVSSNLTTLIKSAQTTDPAVLARRLTSGTFSRAHKTLFDGFSCPEPCKTNQLVTGEDTFKLLSRIIILEFDFQDTTSQDELRLIAELQQALRSKGQIEAIKLYNRLTMIRGEVAPHGGHINYSGLLKKIISDFELVNHPVYDLDWKKIESITKNKLTNIPDKIGGRYVIDRRESIRKANEALLETKFLFLIGRSGYGKTVLTKALASGQVEQGGKVIWLDADLLQFNSLTTVANLNYPVEELIERTNSLNNLIIVDGADRLFKENLIDHLMPLIRQVIELDPFTWKMIITCQSEDYETFLKSLYRRNLPLLESKTIEIEAVSKDDLLSVALEFPQLRQLLKHDYLISLLRNMKYLDLITYHIGTADFSPLENRIGETALVDWIWEQEISDNGQNGSVNSRFLQTLAIKQADHLSVYTPVSEFKIEESAPITELKRLKLVGEANDRLYFIHDLFGDWARYKVIRSQGDQPKDYLLAVDLASPLWSKAIRLFGIYLLEKEANAFAWLAFFNSLSAVEARQKLIRATLLEAIIFSNNTSQYLEDLWADLQKSNGKLMNQFFEQFLIRGTNADPNMLKLAGTIDSLTVSFIATNYRVPIYNYWFPVLQFIKAHGADLVEHSRGNCIRIISLWLQNVAVGSDYRTDMAALAVKVAEWLVDEKEDGTIVMDKAGEKIYGLMLKCYEEFPDQVAILALKLARRKKFPKPKKSQNLNRTWHPLGRQRANQIATPHAPFDRVDDDFKEVSLNTKALNSMIKINPELAKEILLALLIKDAGADEDSTSKTYGLNKVYNWFPPFYTRGPFSEFLLLQGTIAIKLIIELTNLATQNWKIDLENPTEAVNVILDFPDGVQRTYFGDNQLYFWFRDAGNASHSLVSALMSLEKFLIDQIVAGTDVKPYIQLILQESESVAMLGLLSSVGKTKPDLFAGVLKPLLTQSELYHWEMMLGVNSSIEGHQLIGAELLGIALANASVEWHKMPHRKKPLSTVAHQLFFNDPTVKNFFDEIVIPQWVKLRNKIEDEGALDPYLNNLIAQLDLDNYYDTTYEGQPALMYKEPDILTEKLHSVRAEIANDGNFDGFSFRIMQAIEQNKKYAEDELDEIWEKILHYHSLPQDQNTSILNKPDANVLAGITVLLHHEELLKSTHPEYLEWALDQLDYSTAAWEYDFRNMAVAPLFQSADSFCALVVPFLYKHSPTDERTRRIVSNVTLKARHPVIVDLFKHLGNYYEWHNPLFIEVQNLYIERCHIVHNLKISVWDTSSVNFKSLLAPLQTRFLRGKISQTLVDFSIYREKLEVDKIVKTRRRHGVHYATYLDVGLDLHGLYHAYKNLPQVSSQANTLLDHFVMQFYSSIIKLLTYSWGEITDDRLPIDEWPTEFDKWIAVRIAKFLPLLKSADEGKSFWEPLIAYGNLHHRWLEEFTFQLHYANLETTQTEQLGVHWNAIIDYSFKKNLGK
jgi:hypothetical protein